MYVLFGLLILEALYMQCHFQLDFSFPPFILTIMELFMSDLGPCCAEAFCTRSCGGICACVSLYIRRSRWGRLIRLRGKILRNNFALQGAC